MKLRIGFAGVGAMGFSHLKAIQDWHSQVAEITALSTRDETKATHARALAPRAQVFTDDAALIRSDVDAVFISTPNFSHVPLALLALEHKKHVFLEKPVGITADECHQLAVVAQRSDRVVMIGHELRYSPYFQQIKALVDAGGLGVPRLVWCREFRGPFLKKSRDWIQDGRLSGGALVDKNCHHFDLMNWWIGSRPSRVAAFGGNAVARVIEGEHQVLDHATVSFEYANGARGSLQLCMFAPDLQGEDLEMGVIGDEGLLQTRLSTLEILVWKRNAENQGPTVHRVDAKRGEGWGGHLGFSEIHAAFLDAILHRQRPLTTIPDCIDGTLLAIAAEQSIKEKRMIELASTACSVAREK